MVKVAGRELAGAVVRAVKGIVLPLLPTCWDRYLACQEIRPVTDAGFAAGLATVIASRENMVSMF